MTALTIVLKWWGSHGTKYLGAATMIVTGLREIPNLIAAAHQPYWAAAGVVLGALTINRGFINSKPEPTA